MPLFEEKLISPFAVRFSQARIRPTFQDGRELDASFAEIQASPCEIQAPGGRRYTVLLRAPFPPIEVIRWQPRRGQGSSQQKALSSGSGSSRREPQWVTFDNRRLCCLQRAAAAQWPNFAAAVVRVLYDMPTERSAIRKMGQTAAGVAVNVARLHDENPRVWDWMAETRGNGADPSEVLCALSAVKADARAARQDLADAPVDALPRRQTIGPSSAAQLLDLVARLEAEEEIEDEDGDEWQLAHSMPGAAVPTSVARLFELAAESNAEHDQDPLEGKLAGEPKNAAGQELLSLLKGSATPQHHKHVRPVEARILSVPKPPVHVDVKGSQTSVKGAAHSALLDALFSAGNSPSCTPADQDVRRTSAGRELLGLLNPSATAGKPAGEGRGDPECTRIAVGIWDALGRSPPATA